MYVTGNLDAPERRTSLAKGLDLLAVIASCGSAGIALSETARRARIHTATAHRLLGVLVDTNFVSFDPYAKRYHLGLMPYELVARAGPDLAFIDLRRRMRPVLKAVQAELGGIVCLSVPWSGEALCIEVISGDSGISVNTLEVGSRRPLGAGAASLALLATRPEQEREAIILREQERYRKYGDLSVDIVREACAGLSAKGYVVNEGVIIPDIHALAVPVFEGERVVGALSVTNTVSLLAAPRRPAMYRTLARAVRDAGYSVTSEA